MSNFHSLTTRSDTQVENTLKKPCSNCKVEYTHNCNNIGKIDANPGSISD
jgi:hypothetical protein